MKIGIITYHKAHNYGAILQAIATRMVLEQMGHKVYYVDYWPSYHREAYKLFSWHRFKKFKFGYLKNRLTHWTAISSRIKHFEADINRHIEPFCIPYSKESQLDVVVYGSDQIWRKQFATGQLNPVYFGCNVLTAPRNITYAASMGVLIEEETIKNEISKWLKNFDKISIREMDLQEYIAGMGYRSELVLDPTLLVDRNMWDSILPQHKIAEPGYVLYYSLNAGAFDTEVIKEFAKRKHLRFVEVKGAAGRDSENCISQCGPTDFVSLIKGASYVFSTSYHGLIFSIIYEKNFYTSFSSNGGRANSILEITGLRDRMLQPMVKTIPELVDIDYTSVKKCLSPLRLNSIDYLNQALHNGK